MNTLWLELNSWVNTWWYEVASVVSKYIKVNNIYYSNTTIFRINNTNIIRLTNLVISNNVIVNNLYTTNTYD